MTSQSAKRGKSRRDLVGADLTDRDKNRERFEKCRRSRKLGAAHRGSPVHTSMEQQKIRLTQHRTKATGKAQKRQKNNDIESDERNDEKHGFVEIEENDVEIYENTMTSKAMKK